jgi:hypothetical protein
MKLMSGFGRVYTSKFLCLSREGIESSGRFQDSNSVLDRNSKDKAVALHFRLTLQRVLD